jgi:hypothetical protein
MNSAKKVEKVRKLIATGRALIGSRGRTSDPSFITWKAESSTFLTRTGAHCANAFNEVIYMPLLTTRSTTESTYQQLFDAGMGRAVALLESARIEIEDYEEPSEIGTVETPLNSVLNTCRRFPAAARQLQTRRASRPGIEQKDEYDVQDVLHAFLRIGFDDVRPEEWTPSYGGTSARVDFLLPDHEIVIEVKRTRDGLGAKQAKEQLAIDIDHYRVHAKCRTLVCFVYDPDHQIPNPVGFEKDLEGQRTDSLDVRVVVAPHP